LLFLAWTILNPQAARAQTRPAPFYALPADGTWVEFAWTFAPKKDITRRGVLRISCVGEREIRGVPCRWVELKRTTKEVGRTQTRIRKLLVAERAFQSGQQLEDNVFLAFARDEAESPVRKLSARHLADVLHLGIEGPDSGFAAQPVEEKLDTRLSQLVVRHVTARGQRGERRLEYHGWLTRDVPFGWARMELREQTGAAAPRVIYTATVVRRGQDATSEVDESRDSSKPTVP
jgi:hypothetical protein